MKTIKNSTKNSCNRLVMMIGIASLCGSCCGVKIDRPVQAETPQTAAIAGPSYLEVQACVSNADFLKAVRENIQNPIVKDDKPVKVVAAILATEDLTVNRIVSVLVKPFEPGYFKDVAVRSVKTVSVAFGCWISPWKWGKCWKKVLKEVWTTTKVWVEPVAAVYELQTIAVMEIINRVYQPEVTIHYPTYLDDIKIAFTGNKYRITGYTTTHIKLDVQGNVIPLTPEVKIKSLLALDVSCEVIIEGDVSITNDKKIVVSPGIHTFNVKTPMDQLPRISGKDFYHYLFVELALAKTTEAIVENIGKDALQKALDKAVDGTSDTLNFSDQITYLTQAMSGPRELSEDIWLNVKPLEISCSNPYGNGEQLCMNIGLQFEPSVSYSQAAPDFPLPGDVAFKVTGPQPPIVNINLKLSGQLETLKMKLSEAINEELQDSNNKILKSLSVENVNIYRTENNKAVIGLDVIRKRRFYTCKVFSAFLLGDLSFDNVVKEFSIKNVDFSLATKSKLLNTAYKVFVDQKFEDYIEQQAVFSIESHYEEANRRIQNLHYTTDYGILSGNLELTGLSGPFITDSSIDVTAYLKGAYVFQLIPQKPELFTENVIAGAALETTQVSDTSGRPIAADIKLLDQHRIASAPLAKGTESSLLPLYDTAKQSTKGTEEGGEFIYIKDENGKIVKKRKHFEDQIFSGDDIILMDSTGVMKIIVK